MDMYRQELEEFARDAVENGRLANEVKAGHLKETYHSDSDKSVEDIIQREFGLRRGTPFWLNLGLRPTA